MRFLIFFLYFSGFSFFVKAKEISVLNSLNGLSQNDVNVVFQDSHGFIWIGTNDGLNRFDGYKFKIYRNEPRMLGGLRSNIINSIVEDTKGNLWVGSVSNGVSKLDIGSDRFETIVKIDKEYTDTSLSGNLKLFVDKSDRIWVITNNRIKVIDSNTLIVTNVNVSLENNVGFRSIYEVDNGRILLGTTNGIIELNAKSLEVEYRHDYGVPVLDIKEWKRNLLIVNKFGLYSVDDNRVCLTKISAVKGGKGILIDGNSIWVSLIKKTVAKILVFKNKNLIKTKLDSQWNQVITNIGDFNVSSIMLDDTGLLWIGTSGSGLRIYNSQSGFFKHYKPTSSMGSLSDCMVRSIAEDSQGNLWIGTENGNLDYLARSNSTDYINGFERKLTNLGFVTVIHSDKKNNKVWVGLPSGIKIFDAISGKEDFSLDQKLSDIKSIFSILVDSNNVIWIGTYGNGVYRLSKKSDGIYKTENFKNNGYKGSLSSNIVRSILEDREGNIWLGTANGLNKINQTDIDKDEFEFRIYRNDINNDSSISHNYILSLFQGDNDTIWIGTLGGGLNRIKNPLNEYVSFESFTTVEGLPNNVIKGILEDKNGNLWISSNKGISCFNVVSKTIRNFGINDGLQADEFRDLACCQRKNGEMLFGGVNGINVFDAKDVSIDSTKVNIVLTDLYISNTPILVGETNNERVVLKKPLYLSEELHLNYNENSFAIQFTGLHFASPENNKYKYKLVGFDSDWVLANASSRIAKYTNLNAGTYELIISGANSDGFWSDKTKRLIIHIGTPWWFSKISMIFYAIVLLFVLWFFRRYTIIESRRKYLLEMEIFEKEKIEKLSQMKLNFFTNISHEFRTPLTLILGPITKISQEVDHMSETKKREIYQLIQRNANRMLKLINQLMDFRKFEQNKLMLETQNLDLIPFVKEIFESFVFMAKEKEIEFCFFCEEKELMLWFDPEKMEKIVMNLLSNAFKFSLKGGCISVQLVSNENMVDIIVKDEGIGIPVSQQQQVFNRFYQVDKFKDLNTKGTGIGLAFTKGLVDMHRGDITLESIENVGSKFTVSIKKGNEHFEANEMIFDEKEISNHFNKSDLLVPKMFEEDSTSDDLKREYSILVVEDNVEMRKFIVENLERYYIVYQAENGKDAIENCKKNVPDIIVSDVMMPVMDGFEMCKSLKLNIHFSHIPIVLLTAKTANENKIKGYSLGANAYVEKPFDFGVLIAQIRAMLNHKKMVREKFKKSIEIVPENMVTTKVDDEFLGKVLSKIEASSFNKDFSINDLALECGMSTSNLNKKLKGLTGKTTNAFVRSIRLKKAARLLQTGRYSVTDVTYEVGFSDLKYFRESFKQEFNMSPSVYKKDHKIN